MRIPGHDGVGRVVAEGNDGVDGSDGEVSGDVDGREDVEVTLR